MSQSRFGVGHCCSSRAVSLKVSLKIALTSPDGVPVRRRHMDNRCSVCGACKACLRFKAALR
eukprot:12403894-Alexandrium_andersonii.AAC.1